MQFNICDFGAVGDGKTLNTKAIATAIKALDAAGGGTLVIPPGTFLTGTVNLVSNMTLLLEAGATLLGSPDVKDYPADPNADRFNIYLIEGRGLHNVRICGDGIIDGNGMAFWHEEDGSTPKSRTDGNSSSIMLQYDILAADWHRPPMIYLFNCQDVQIQDVTLRESAFYTVWLVGCCDAKISGITIRNYHLGPNTDGIDVDCSQRVLIQNCDIETGDDAIALKSDNRRAQAPNTIATEDVTVTNCVLWTRCCGVRVGYEGDGFIHNCTFSNIVIRRAKHGIDMLSLVPIVYEHFVCRSIFRGTPIENIRFSDITMNEVGQAFFIWSGNECDSTGYEAYIKNIEFCHIMARSIDSSFIGARELGKISDVRMHQVRLYDDNSNTAPDEGGITEDGMPSVWGGGFHLGALRALRVDNLELKDVTIISSQKDCPVISMENVRNLRTDGCLFTVPNC